MTLNKSHALIVSSEFLTSRLSRFASRRAAKPDEKRRRCDKATTLGRGRLVEPTGAGAARKSIRANIGMLDVPVSL